MKNNPTFFRLGATQTVTVGAASAQTASAFGTQTYWARIISTTAAHISFGASPTATSSDAYIAAGREEIFRVLPGQKVAVIQNAAGGTLYVSELTQ